MSHILLGASRAALAFLFAGAGAMHFIVPGVFARIVPPLLPRPTLLVYLSGLFEMAGGIGLLFRRTRRAAGAGLLLLLLAVWPANFQMLFDARGRGVSALYEALLWLRLPLQVPLMLWVWAVSLRRNSSLRPGGNYPQIGR